MAAESGLRKKPIKPALYKKSAPGVFSGRGLDILLLHAVLNGLDHFLNHLSADVACLLGGQIAVITLFEGYSDIGGCFHFETIEGFPSVGYNCLIIIVRSHEKLLLNLDYSPDSLFKI
jgi:hypothetical protein